MTKKKKTAAAKAARTTKSGKRASGSGKSGNAKNSSKSDIRSSIREKTLKIIQEHNLKLEDLSILAEEVLTSAVSGIKDAIPSARQSALHQVVMGLSDAWAVTAEASEATLRHAKRYGLAFAKKDLRGLAEQLQDLERHFLKTVSGTAEKLKGDIGQELQSVAERVKKAGTDIKPSAEKAQKAVTHHLAELVGEVATTGVKVGTKVVGAALMGASGFLEGVGKSITSKKPVKPKSKR